VNKRLFPAGAPAQPAGNITGRLEDGFTYGFQSSAVHPARSPSRQDSHPAGRTRGSAACGLDKTAHTNHRDVYAQLEGERNPSLVEGGEVTLKGPETCPAAWATCPSLQADNLPSPKLALAFSTVWDRILLVR
jgi:hypothetical protein